MVYGLIPERIGQFDILDEIGRGGMGVVYLARQPSLGRLVAVKVMQVDDAALTARLKNEARVLAELQHPHIVSVLDVGDDGGFPYYAMAYCAGGSLAQVLERDGTLTGGQAAQVLAVVAEALAAMHDRGLVHRDVKPSNVLLSADGEPYLSDFGLALGGGSGRVTSSGAVLGTIGYAAPELLGEEEVTSAADVFSLGVMGYQLLAGVLPFRGAHILGVMEAVRTGRFTPLGEAAPDAGGKLVELITSCLHPDPAARPGDLRVLAESLRSCSPRERLRPAAQLSDSDRTVTRRRSGDPSSLDRASMVTRRRWRRPLVLLPVVGVVLLVALVGGLLVASGDGVGTAAGQPDPTSTAVAPRLKLSSGIEAGLAGLAATRTWTVEGTSFSSAIEVVNTTSLPVTSYHAEVIPKGVAASAAAATFEPASVRVLKDDPIVAWDLTLAPGEKRALAYRATLAQPVTAADLPVLEAERATAYRALLDFVATQGGAAQTAPPDLAGFTPPTAPGTPTPEPPPATVPPGTGGPLAPTATTSAAAPPPTPGPTPKPVPPPITLPGAVGNVVVARPTGDDRSIAVDLTWSRPAATGGQITGYKFRRTTFGSASDCDNAGVVRAGPVTASTGETTVRATATGATEPCLSWIRWEVAAFNSAGDGPFVAATGIMPDVYGLQNAYHLIRAVGGRAGGGEDRYCYVPPYAACATSVPAGTRIQNGTDVTVFQQK